VPSASVNQSTFNYTSDTKTTGITINNTGGGLAHNNVQPTIVMNYIIKR
jgi:microcystin-dependent protein